MLNSIKKIRGMTLIETMSSIAIISLLVTLAFYSYQHYFYKAHRTEATIGLLDLATRLEHYYAEHNTYVGANITGNLGYRTATTAHGFYTLNLDTVTRDAYVLRATPVAHKSQARDLICGSFIFTQTGQKIITGTGSTAECWGG